MNFLFLKNLLYKSRRHVSLSKYNFNFTKWLPSPYQSHLKKSIHPIIPSPFLPFLLLGGFTFWREKKIEDGKGEWTRRRRWRRRALPILSAGWKTFKALSTPSPPSVGSATRSVVWSQRLINSLHEWLKFNQFHWSSLWLGRRRWVVGARHSVDRWGNPVPSGESLFATRGVVFRVYES